MKRLVSVTSGLVWAVTVSGLSANVSKLLILVVDGLAAPNLPQKLLFPVPVAFLFPILSKLPTRHLFLGPLVRVT